MTTINWRKVKNTVSERMIDRSLAHKFIIPDDNFKQMKIKTIIFNRLLQSRCYTYKRYVQLKKSMIKIISEEKDIESLNDIDHIFDKFILPVANDDIDSDIDNNNYNSDQSNNSLDNNKDTEFNEVDESANVNDTDENRIVYSNQFLDHQFAEEQLNSNNNSHHNEHEIFNDSDDDGNASDSMSQYHEQESSVTTKLKSDSEDDIYNKYSPLIHNDADDNDDDDRNVSDSVKQFDEKESSVTSKFKSDSEDDIYNKYSPLIHNDDDDDDNNDGNVGDSMKQYHEHESLVTTKLKSDSEDDIDNNYSSLIHNDSDDDDGNLGDSMKQYHEHESLVTTKSKSDSEDDIYNKLSPSIHNDSDDNDDDDGNVGDSMKQYNEAELSVTSKFKSDSEDDIYNNYSSLIHNDSDDNDDDDDGNVGDSMKQYDEKELSVTSKFKSDSEDDIYNKLSPLIHNDSVDNDDDDDDDGNVGDSMKQYDEKELVTTKLKSDSEDDIDNNYSPLIHNDVGDNDNDIDDNDDKQSSTSGKNKTQVKITNYEVVTSKYTIIKDKNKILDHQNFKNANKQSLNINENNNFNSVTLSHPSSDNDNDDDINNDSLNYYHLKEKRKLKIDNNKSYGPSLIATPKVSESLEYVLKNLPFREYYSQPKENDDLSSSYVNNNSDISDYDIDGYIEDELMSKRPTDIDDFAISRKLITLSSTQSSCTFEDLNEDDEIFVMDIPKSIVDKGNLEGQSMKLKKRSIKIGDTRYKISIKDNDEFTCVFRLNNQDDLYKIENIQPIKSIVIQEPQSTPDKRDSFYQDDNIVEDFEDPIPFPNNLKTRNPLMLDHQRSIKLKHSKRKENDSLQNDTVKSKKVKIF